MNKYKDIIDLSRPKSKNHAPMPLNNRAAQFSPFSALAGYEEEIKETARETMKKIELTEEQKIILNNKINWLKKKIKELPQITITYFVPDLKKNGGKYETMTTRIRTLDEIGKTIILTTKQKIKIENMHFLFWTTLLLSLKKTKRTHSKKNIHG